MTDRLLDLIKARYTLTELDAGEFATLKANGMKFAVKAYCAKGLGHVSVMRAKGFFGLMKMDTVMVVPYERDLPLYSYDRIYAMGNDVLISELYNTEIGEVDLTALDAVKARYTHLTERDPGEHWYDEIKLSQSISKKGKKSESADFDAFVTEHLEAYLDAPCGDVSDLEKKKALSRRYVNGLLTEGGPSTDVFKKALGEEKTARLFGKVLFGTD